MLGLGVKFVKWGAGIQDSDLPTAEVKKLQALLQEAEEQGRTAQIEYPDEHGNTTYVFWKDAGSGKMKREPIKINRAVWNRLQKQQREKEEKERKQRK